MFTTFIGVSDTDINFGVTDNHERICDSDYEKRS